MKKVLIILTLFVFSSQLFAQNNSQSTPISIGYLGNLGYQPGARIGIQFDLKNWEVKTDKYTKLKSFYVSPQIGFYTWRDRHTSFLVNADIGYKRIKSHKRTYSAFSIGLAYLHQSQITDIRVNLSDGSKDKERVNWGWFLPTLNYGFGKAFNDRIGWYSKLSYGLKMASERESSSVLLVELGMTFNLF